MEAHANILELLYSNFFLEKTQHFVGDISKVTFVSLKNYQNNYLSSFNVLKF